MEVALGRGLLRFAVIVNPAALPVGGVASSEQVGKKVGKNIRVEEKWRATLLLGGFACRV